MELVSDIRIRRTRNSRLQQVDFDQLEFGKYISDHMYVCDFAPQGWGEPMILPFANLSLSPAALALHYGQTVFEGMKAFRMQDGRVNIFRMDRHYERFCISLDRMCMPAPPRQLFYDALQQLVETDKAWVPSKAGDALYIRPFMFATEAKMGVKISDEYRFIVYTGPVPELYAKPVQVKVETHYVRATRGGTGYAKCGGNYGAAFYPLKKAREEGYDQVLWTDARDNRFIEESGTMNVMFVINGVLVTPPLSDSILDGIARDSLLILAHEMDIPVEERPVSVEEITNGLAAGTLTEAFGVGTAAVISPIAKIGIDGTRFNLPEYQPSSVHRRLKQQLTAIRTGTAPDYYGWNFIN